jgi:hypothetical protein
LRSFFFIQLFSLNTPTNDDRITIGEETDSEEEEEEEIYSSNNLSPSILQLTKSNSVLKQAYRQHKKLLLKIESTMNLSIRLVDYLQIKVQSYSSLQHCGDSYYINSPWTLLCLLFSFGNIIVDFIMRHICACVQ